MSKTLEPIAFETAMSPWPLRATSREPIASGTEVPAARRVQPMIAGWMLSMQPILEAHETMKYERMPIHSTDEVNVIMYNDFFSGSVQSGIVILKSDDIGATTAAEI